MLYSAGLLATRPTHGPLQTPPRRDPRGAGDARHRPGPLPQRVAPLPRGWPWLLAITGLLLAGLSGLDRAGYAFSLRLNQANAGVIGAHDFYQNTKPFWNAARFPGSWIGGVALLVGLCVFHTRGPRVALPAAAALLTAGACTYFLRGVIGRIRPNQSADPYTFAPFEFFLTSENVCLPSGEATAAFAFATILTGLAPRYAYAWYMLALLNGLARLVQGAHFVSDVAAGALVGTLIGGFVFRVVSARFDKPSATAAKRTMPTAQATLAPPANSLPGGGQRRELLETAAARARNPQQRERRHSQRQVDPAVAE